jgi:hypothetical protein
VAVVAQAGIPVVLAVRAVAVMLLAVITQLMYLRNQEQLTQVVVAVVIVATLMMDELLAVVVALVLLLFGTQILLLKRRLQRDLLHLLRPVAIVITHLRVPAQLLGKPLCPIFLVFGLPFSSFKLKAKVYGPRSCPTHQPLERQLRVMHKQQ